MFIDLTAGEMAARTAIIAYQKLAGPDAWLVAFGPHVEAEALAAAKAAGCHLVSLAASSRPNSPRYYIGVTASP